MKSEVGGDPGNPRASYIYQLSANAEELPELERRLIENRRGNFIHQYFLKLAIL